MSIVNEEIKIAEGAGRVMILERTKGEAVRPWAIISLDLGSISRMTPSELRTLGRELYAIGQRVGREYTSIGKLKGSIKAASGKESA
ncbi:MAG: hypothetical protein ACM3WS_08130 [Bacillota bacterium]